MFKKKGRPKEALKDVKKINPPNVIKSTQPCETATTGTAVSYVLNEVTYKCDNPKCPSAATVFINARFCKLCAGDHGF